MGELERYGLLSAALLLLMAGLLAFFGRDSADDAQGARALSANARTLERDAGLRGVTHDPGSAAPRGATTKEPAESKASGATETAPPQGGELRPRPPGGVPPSANPDESKATETPLVQPVEAEAPVHYKVKAGDTLSAIAKVHFGDKKYYPLIEAANPGIDPNALKVDQELILPAKAAIADFGKQPLDVPAPSTGKPREVKGHSNPKLTTQQPVPTEKATPPTKAPPGTLKDKKDGGKPVVKAGAREHRVVKGDTLTSIARQYYADPNKWKVIFEANRDKLKSTSIVPEGVVLKIP